MREILQGIQKLLYREYKSYHTRNIGGYLTWNIKSYYTGNIRTITQGIVGVIMQSIQQLSRREYHRLIMQGNLVVIIRQICGYHAGKRAVITQ